MTQQQEYQLRKQAADRGYSPQQINQFIQFAKQKESSPTPAQPPQKEKGDGFLKRLVKDAASPFLKLGATADAFGTSRLLGGKGADTRTRNVPFFGGQKPITSVKEAAGVGGELALEAVGGEIVSRVAKPVVKAAVRGGKALIKGAPKAVEAAGKAASEALETVTSTVDKGTKSVLNPLQKIPKEVLPEATERLQKNAAKIESRQISTQQKLDRYVKQAQKAMQDYSQETPLEMAGREGERALQVLDEKLTKHGQLKTKAIEKVGKLKLKKVSEVRNMLRDKLIERTGTGISAKGELVQIAGRKSSLPSGDVPLLKTVIGKLQELGDSPTLREIDDTVDYIQGELYKRSGVGADPVDKKVVAILKEVTGELNKRVKKVAGKSYRTANDKYSYFIDVRDTLNKALGTETTKGGSLMKRVFSPTDGGTKRLFAEIKKLTGIDLTEEATLAKFAMEKVGDARQASLLEQLELLRPKGALGWLEKGANIMLDRARDPIREAGRVIEEGKRMIR